MNTDEKLQRDVLEELDWEPSIDASQIGVTAKGGVVTLTGHVPVYAAKHAAEEVVKRVHRVRAVANDIEVRPAESHQRDDSDIAAAALHAVTWDSGVPDDRVQITVSDGWVKLEGTVDWQHEKAATDRAVRHLIGARGVTNEIIVNPSEAGNEVQERVEAAYLRSATLNSRKIAVVTEKGKVTLTGDVHSCGELEEAERTAWAAGGVHVVDNCLTITPWGEGPAEEWGY